MTTETLVLQTSPLVTLGYFIQLLFSLGVVVGIIFLIGRFLLPKLKVGGNGLYLTVLDRLPLEPQVTAYLLATGEKCWLVVSSNKQVTRVAELKKGELSPNA